MCTRANISNRFFLETLRATYNDLSFCRCGILLLWLGIDFLHEVLCRNGSISYCLLIYLVETSRAECALFALPEIADVHSLLYALLERLYFPPILIVFLTGTAIYITGAPCIGGGRGWGGWEGGGEGGWPKKFKKLGRLVG